MIAGIGHGLVGGRSFTQLLSDNLRLLARKVIERAGRTGEHYVTSSRKDYFKMLGSAAGGGVMTCGTAILKFFVKWGHFAPFIDGLLSSTVYAGSFILMQLVGFTLAAMVGSLMFLARASDFISNGAFLLKMLLLFTAGTNAAILHSRGPLNPDSLVTRGQALFSLLLWIAIIVCGRWIAYV